MPSLPGTKPASVKKPNPRPRDEDDEVAEAAPRRPVKGRSVNGAVQEGWDGAENQKGDPNYAQQPKVKKGETFYFKFIPATDEIKQPYAAVKIHWVDRKGKTSFLCPQTDDCPLCMLGNVAKFEARFNIALLGEEEPLLRSLSVGQQQSDEFRDFHNDRRTGPLWAKFYSRTRPSGPGGRWKTAVFKRDSDLADEIEDHRLKLYIPTDEEVVALGGYTKADASNEVNLKELQDIADEMSDDYEDDDD